MAPTLRSHAYTSWYVGICRVYIYICTNLNYKKFYEIGISLEYNVRGTPFFRPPLPPKCSCSTVRLKQPGWPCPSVRPCNGFKPLKWATEVAVPLVPRGQRLPTWKSVIMCLWEKILVVGYWNDTINASFSFWICFFFFGGGKGVEWMVMTKIMEHTLVASRQIRQIPFKMASFTMESKVHQELSDELDEKVKYVMASVPFNLSLWKVGYDGNVAEGFLWVTWVTWVTWVLKHSLHVFRLEPSFRKDFFCVPLFFRLAPKVLSELVRFQDRAKEQNTMKFAKLKRALDDEKKSEILNVPWVWVWGDTTWDLQRLRMFIFETKRAITFPGFCVGLREAKRAINRKKCKVCWVAFLLDDWMIGCIKICGVWYDLMTSLRIGNMDWESFEMLVNSLELQSWVSKEAWSSLNHDEPIKDYAFWFMERLFGLLMLLDSICWDCVDTFNK